MFARRFPISGIELSEMSDSGTSGRGFSMFLSNLGSVAGVIRDEGCLLFDDLGVGLTGSGL